MLEKTEVTTMHCPLCRNGMVEKNTTLAAEEKSILHDQILVCLVCLLEGHQASLKMPQAAKRTAEEHKKALKILVEKGQKATIILEAITLQSDSSAEEVA